MEKVKRFLKVQTEACEQRQVQQTQLHPQVGRRRRKSRGRRDGRHPRTKEFPTETGEQKRHSGSIVDQPTQIMDQPETLRQKAFAKLRLFNFSRNWDLQCKPKGLLTRRLYSRQKQNDNELYRSNSFRFQRFERNINLIEGHMQNQISICDEYSVPFDFINKRPSSFDPSLVGLLPNNWPSPSSEHVTFLDQRQSFFQPSLKPDVPQLQQHFDIQNREFEEPNAPEGFIDEAGNLRLLKFNDILVDAVRESITRRGTCEKICLSQKPRKKKRARKQPLKLLDSSVPNSSENEEDPLLFDGRSVPKLNSPDSSINDETSNPLQNLKTQNSLLTPERCRTAPSPYYYSDLLKKDAEKNQLERRQLFAKHSTSTVNSIKEKEKLLRHRKSCSLDTAVSHEELVTPVKRRSITEQGVRIIRCDSPSSTTSDESNCSECQKRRQWHSHALAVVRAATKNLRKQSPKDVEPEVYYQNSIISQMPHNQFLDQRVICGCTAPTFNHDNRDEKQFQPQSIFYVHQQDFQGCSECRNTNDERLKALIFDEMNVRQRKLYETAFDSTIAKSDNLDDVDRITNHSASLFGNDYRMVTSHSKDNFIVQPRDKISRSSKNKNSESNDKDVQNYSESSQQIETSITKEIQNIKIEDSIDNIVNTDLTAISNSYSSPPSTAPLPLKFPSKHEKCFINSIKSAPNLPASHALQHPRLKDLRGKTDTSKDRPRSMMIEAGRVFQLKKMHSGRNYSSTESMTTSSSGGSMESIRSSTSEGNRSTTSNDSRHSSSMSSHSSDSGANVVRVIRAPGLINPNLQILSPISDKSAPEIVTENNENNKIYSAKETSDVIAEKTIDDITDKDITKQKKRPTPSKTLLLISRDEIQGSDSGISLLSRDDKKKQNALCDNKLENVVGLPQDLKDLPFDMPKLRRRKVLLNQNSGTSGSATSVDLGELPFDMPKLRRRMRGALPPDASNTETLSGLLNPNEESCSGSQASSSQRDARFLNAVRQNLTLDLNDMKSMKTKKPFGTLELHGLPDGENMSNRSFTFNVGGFNRLNMALIDVTIPLERQGWYHGAITRVDAENVLRQLSEGSFLVRNSESTKQDYSLSLKSAKGFMHMRIQKQNESGEYILGQFSRPFKSIPEMIRHFCLNRLPVRGAEHMCLLDPVIVQLL